jgi:hypothetical protein
MALLMDGLAHCKSAAACLCDFGGGPIFAAALSAGLRLRSAAGRDQ